MIEKNRKIVPRSFGTHDGTFHADEVTACALLLLFDLIDPDKIVRTRDEERLSHCAYVCDVGAVYDPEHQLFDHHQVEYQGDLSSAGMILLYLKEQKIIDDHAFHVLNNAVIRGVDDHDNGRDPQLPGVCTYSHVMANFTPIHPDVTAEEQDAAFYEALAFGLGHLKRVWKRYQYICSCRDEVARAMEAKGECLFFDRALSWLEPFFELGGEQHPARFVIMPTGEHWKLRGIPPSLKNRMDVRCPLPVEWAGLLDDDLKKVSGIPGAIFCHKGRFISVWETRDDAVKALEYTLKECSS
ncbi:MAG: MYG1 family protein [Chlamydiales bacterium]|nr:MYG1 family protein [Chlamydiia bacterium]MCP5506763.1 MYG1 family protein [Chlamydiales bacterium]